MEITLNKGALPASVPIPLYTMITVGTATSRDSERFKFVMGLDKAVAAELKHFSLDESDTDLQENTSDYKRFGTGSYEEWYSKGRVPFALIHEKSGALAALVWFGPKPLGRKSLKHLSEKELQNEKHVASGDWHTVTFRSYAPFRGQGLMKGFTRAAMDIYCGYFPNARLWAGINRKNPGSLALGEKLGFAIDENVSDADWVAMVK